MFQRLRAHNMWVPGSVVAPEEWEAFDENISWAIDGKGGGVYAPIADLTIGGAPGVKIVFQTQFNAEGDVQIGTGPTGVFNVESTSFISGEFNVTGLSDFQNDVQFQTNVFFYDDVTFNEDVTVGATGIFGVYGEAGFHGLAAFQGPVFVHQPVTFADAGKLVQRQLVISTDADQVVRPAEVDSVYLPDGVFTATHSLRIDDTGAMDGMRLHVCTADTQSLAVRRPDTSLIGDVPLSLGVNTKVWMTVERISGVWKQIAAGRDEYT